MNEELLTAGKMLFTSSSVFQHLSAALPLFGAYGIQHITALGVIAILCILIAWFGSRGKSSIILWLGRLVSLFLVGYALVFYLQQYFAKSLSWEYSLPLELCSLVLIVGMIALFWRNQLAAEIVYFWGLGGGLHALATPDLAWGFPSWSFILYFWGHGVTTLTVVYLIACRNFRPRAHSVLRMMIALNLYALIVGAINAAAGWNYGYLCAKPSTPSLLDHLGPWPWYLLAIELIAWLTFLILDIPWRLKGKQAAQSPDSLQAKNQ